MKTLPATLAACLLGGSVGIADAAAIYRCGPDGKTFSQTPCADGQLLDSSDPRSAAQKVEARRIAERERQAAKVKAGADKASAPPAGEAPVKPSARP